jgi:hypothetical protein
MLTSTVNAATFSVYENQVINLTGEIFVGDAEKFRALLKEYPFATVLNLNSPGGDADEGLDIAAEVYNNHMATSIEIGGRCASMCPIIFLSGSSQYMEEHQIIEVHPAYYLDKDEKKIYHIQANLAIAWWLGVVKAPHKLVDLINNVDPNTIFPIDAEKSSELGLNIQLVRLVK